MNKNYSLTNYRLIRFNLIRFIKNYRLIIGKIDHE